MGHSPEIIALVPLARERGLRTVYVPAIDAREAVLDVGTQMAVSYQRAQPQRLCQYKSPR